MMGMMCGDSIPLFLGSTKSLGIKLLREYLGCMHKILVNT